MRKLTGTVKLMLLDEPTASLDLRHQIDVLAALRRCADRGVTVIAVLHDLNLAALYAERIVVLDRGRIAADGPPSDTITDTMLDRVFGVPASVGRAPPPASRSCCRTRWRVRPRP